MFWSAGNYNPFFPSKNPERRPNSMVCAPGFFLQQWQGSVLRPLVGAIEEGDDLRSCAVVVGAERGFARAGGHAVGLRTGAGGVGRERPLRRAGGDAVFHGPRNGLCIVAVGDHVGHACRSALGFRRAGRTPQEGHDLAAGAGLLRPEEVAADAVRDALLLRPLDRLISNRRR